jgi:molybdopterin-guanine dinucleotide biosynthesis protein B
MTVKIIGVAGFKNAGKTTLVERLVRELTGRGYRISTVKHAHHSFDIDHEGRDSFRHRHAGAEVAVISGQRWAIIHELRDEAEPSFDAILAKLGACDLVIVEGYKHGSHEKIEVRNLDLDHPKLAGADPTIVAIAANGKIADAQVPVFDRDHVAALADFIITHMRLARK